MQVTFQAVHFHADQKLKDFISEKLEKLTKFYPKIIDATVFMRLENSGQIKDKIVEIKLAIRLSPGALGPPAAAIFPTSSAIAVEN